MSITAEAKNHLKVHDKNSVCAICNCQIKENALFTGLTPSQLDAFKDVVVINNFVKRETVYVEGNECHGTYIIRKGRVKIVRSSASGKEQIIKILSSGDLLGFEIFYDARFFVNSAVAMEDAELCYIDKRSFFRIVEKDPSIAKKLILALGAELHSAYDRIGSLGLLNAREKLAHLLYTLCEEYGVAQPGGAVKLNLTLSRLEIAELLGITQETSIRLLKSFKDDGILDIKRKEIIVKSMSRLKEIGE